MSRPLNDQYAYLLNRWMDHPRFNDYAVTILNVIDDFCDRELKTMTGITRFRDEKVMMPKSFHKPFQLLGDKGYVNLALQMPYGVAAPWVLHHMVWEKLAASHISLTTCPMLSFGVLNTLIRYSSLQLQPYIDSLVANQSSATMCLTEAQCGSDLSLIQTKAAKVGDAYHISGHKVWITYGDHDLTLQILHLVLARSSEGVGTRGLSLFLVPKYIGGKKNGVYCRGLVDTMGQEQTPTCMMDFENAKGFLVGELGGGMQAIFTMMNPARIGVGVQALGLAEASYQKALGFSKIRRSVQIKGERVAVGALPDVSRMLGSIEVTQYAMRLLVAYTSYHIDQDNGDIVALLTPILKAYVTEQSVDNISESMQVMGGFGYLKAGRCEQYYRDARVTMIYEGTNGVQAIDLLMRKVLKDKGVTLRKLLGLLGYDSVYRELESIHQAFEKATQTQLLFVASDYLQYLALIVMQRLIEGDEYLDNREKSFYQDYANPLRAMYSLRIVQALKKEVKVC